MPIEHMAPYGTPCLETSLWPKFGGEPDSYQENWWSVVLPQAGELRWINISTPHSTPQGGQLWVLYKPLESDALDYEPEPVGEDILNLDEWAVVRCEVLEQGETSWSRDERLRNLAENPFNEAEWIAELGDTEDGQEFLDAVLPELREQYNEDNIRADPEYRGWVHVRILQCVPLFEIPDVFAPLSDAAPIRAGDWSWITVTPGRQLDYVAYTSQYSGWQVVTKSSPPRLVLAGPPADDKCYILNSRLPDGVVAKPG